MFHSSTRIHTHNEVRDKVLGKKKTRVNQCSDVLIRLRCLVGSRTWGFGVGNLGFGVWVCCLGSGVEGLGRGFRVFRVYGFGFRV